MDETRVKTNSIKAWVLAARPQTLSGAAVPVMIGAGLAWTEAGSDMHWLPALLCLLFAFVMQIDANLINDYFDFQRGNDDAATRLGPLRACSMGWITPKVMLRAIIITTAIGCLIGLPLVYFGGWTMIAVGALCVLFSFLYTTKLSYLGLGDLLVLVFFGIVPVCLTYFLSVPESQQAITWQVFLASIACGLVIDTLLIVNNYRDIENDRRDNKMTFVVRVGASGGRALYISLGIVAMLIASIHIFYSNPWAFWLPLISYMPLHITTYISMCRIDKGRELNKVLGQTGRNMFVYGLTTAIGFLI